VYGIGGPILTQSVGGRVRPLGFVGRHAIHLGADYVAVVGGRYVAQLITGEVGYEYVAAGGLTLIAGIGAFGVLSWFKDDETSGVGPRLRLSAGYSF